jgi:hypothetical protein
MSFQYHSILEQRTEFQKIQSNALLCEKNWIGISHTYILRANFIDMAT